MSKHRPSENSAEETLSEQQKHSSLIAACLQKMALTSVFNKELTELDYEAWEKLLTPYPLKGIDYAFENWQRNGKIWPKPVNIIELIAAWSLSNKVEFHSCGQCDHGWVRIYQGSTHGGKPIDPKVGAVKRCQCFIDWCAAKKKVAA